MNTTLNACQHVMLNLETMGTGPNAAIVAIGAVAFDLERAHIDPNIFYLQVCMDSATKCGGVIDAATVLCWLRQSDEARQELTERPSVHIIHALYEFSAWMKAHTADPKVWGNGASFDNVILRATYERAGLTPPWHWWNDRCYRTAKAMHPHVRSERSRTGLHALDARTQTQHLLSMLSVEEAHE